MTPCIPENFSTWLVDWSLVTGNTIPPRDPDDDDDDDDDDEDAEPDDAPAVIREPEEYCERPNGRIMLRLGGMGLRGPQIVMNSKNHIRAVRYRQLALAEPDRAKADVLLKIADEAGARHALHRRLVA